VAKSLKTETHDTLSLNGQYAGFWARQSGGFIGTEMVPRNDCNAVSNR
jgi:hypothetical protein